MVDSDTCGVHGINAYKWCTLYKLLYVVYMEYSGPGDVRAIHRYLWCTGYVRVHLVTWYKMVNVVYIVYIGTCHTQGHLM